MPWSQSDYPNAFKNLSDPVRSKAIKIANALLKDGHDDSSAIRIAISQAKKSTGNNKKAFYEVEGLAKIAYDYRKN